MTDPQFLSLVLYCIMAFCVHLYWITNHCDLFNCIELKLRHVGIIGLLSMLWLPLGVAIGVLILTEMVLEWGRKA